MIPLFKVATAQGRALQRFNEILQSGYLGQGAVVDEFEKTLKDVLLLPNLPVTVNSCTSALDLALHLCGVGPDDEVISTPVTCFATNAPIINRNARIRWADVNSDFNIDPKSVQNLITPKTKAIMAVNWAGKPCDYEALKSFGIPVIEDAAHCWGPKAPGGDYTCYSFQAIKFLTCGDGGLLVCNEEESERARLLRWYGLDRTKGESFRCAQNITQTGFKYHMNNLAAGLGLENLETSLKNVHIQRKNAEFLTQSIQNVYVKTPSITPNHSCWLYSLTVRWGLKYFIDHLQENGVSASPVHYRNDLYDVTLPFKENRLPGVEEFAQKQVCIPVGWWLTDEELQHIVNTVNSFRCPEGYTAPS